MKITKNEIELMCNKIAQQINIYFSNGEYKEMEALLAIVAKAAFNKALQICNWEIDENNKT